MSKKPTTPLYAYSNTPIDQAIFQSPEKVYLSQLTDPKARLETT
jgi:hypothetical protein